MKHIKVFTFVSVLFIVLCTVAFPSVARAEDEKPSISVKPTFPKNQNMEVDSYFKLLVKPGDKQTVYVQITNNKKESIVVTLTPANAYTRPNGGIFYDANIDSPETILLDKFFALSNYISIAKNVAIKPTETINVPIEITVPDIKTGTLLGGILINEEVPTSEIVKAEPKKNEAKFKVITKTVFAIAIQLDLPNIPLSAFSFEKAGFNPDKANVFIEMRNDAPMIQREIFGVYKVTNKDGEKLFEGKIIPMIMAPKTQINYPMPWTAPILEPGNYTLSITASVAGKEITVDKIFEIEKESVEKYSKKPNQPIAKTQTGLLYFIVITVVVVLGNIIFWIKKRKDKIKKL